MLIFKLLVSFIRHFNPWNSKPRKQVLVGFLKPRKDATFDRNRQKKMLAHLISLDVVSDDDHGAAERPHLRVLSVHLQGPKRLIATTLDRHRKLDD